MALLQALFLALVYLTSDGNEVLLVAYQSERVFMFEHRERFRLTHTPFGILNQGAKAVRPHSEGVRPMDAKKQDEALKSEPASEPTEGSKRLQLSVKRMKKLRAGVKGGSTGEDSWMEEQV